jgi:hypothetical protein
MQTYRILRLKTDAGVRTCDGYTCLMTAADRGTAVVVAAAENNPLHSFAATTTLLTLASIEYAVAYTDGKICIEETFLHRFKRLPVMQPAPLFAVGVNFIRSTKGPLWTTRPLRDLFPGAKVSFGRSVGLQFCC